MGFVAAAKRLTLGVALLVGASLILLFSDRNVSKGGTEATKEKKRKVAIFQFASQPLLDDAVSGVVAGLAEKGYSRGKNLDLEFFNAAMDMTAGATIAKKLVGGNYDLVITVSTATTQLVAGANREGKVKHVFCAVTDPYGAGIGVTSDTPGAHPPYLAGNGTFQPVARAFDLAAKFCPDLRTVGVVWNPSEICSEACVRKAREKCRKMGITLREATVDNSAGVREAAQSLLAKGVDAIYVGGDNTIAVALDTLVRVARDFGVPVFANSPGDIERGVLFALGADYRQVGFMNGALAAEILSGLDPAKLAIRDMVPETLSLNKAALKGLKGRPWRFTDDALARARTVVEADNAVTRQGGAGPATLAAADAGGSGKQAIVSAIYFAPDPSTELALDGLKDALRDRGFNEGKNLTLNIRNAQGEMTQIFPILKLFEREKPDAVVPLTTPCLTAALAALKNASVPIVFTCVYDPLAAGAGTSPANHPPNVTGIASWPPIDALPGLIRQVFPGARNIGTIYNPSEANSAKAVREAGPLFAAAGMKLTIKTAPSVGEVYQAAQALTAQFPDVVWITGDNTATQGLSAIVRTCRDRNIPLVLNDVEFVPMGAALACGVQFREVGYAGGQVLADVLSGTSPAKIPIRQLHTKTIAVNFQAAKDLNLKFPEKLLEEASLFFHLNARFGGRPARLALVRIADNALLDRAISGFRDGLEDAGLKPEVDFSLKVFNAQGEMAQVPLLINAVREGRFDLVVTCGTPVMVNAVDKIKDQPLVFFVASDPYLAGVLKPGDRRDNLTGVHDDPPVRELLLVARDRIRDLKTVGTVYDPSQVNSRISVDKLRAACREFHLALVERTASTVSELPTAAASVAAAGARLIVTSADNLVTSGFPALYKEAARRGLPIYSTEPGLFGQGAEVCIGDDYVQWGHQAAVLAAKVLAGVTPAALPIEKTRARHRLVSDKIEQPRESGAGHGHSENH